jgi:hypothetical protein
MDRAPCRVLVEASGEEAVTGKRKPKTVHDNGNINDPEDLARILIPRFRDELRRINPPKKARKKRTR